jgi:tRNA dimethylallyltransferase
VYRGLDIGAAKPDSSERARVPFHLLDVVAPDEDFNVADFERLANAAIADIRARNRVPVLVGGTGLYVRAVTAVLSLPHVPPQPLVRARLYAEAETNSGASVLYTRLANVDPASAAKINENDRKRIVRALEVFEVTGQPLSSFHTPEGVHGRARLNTITFGLDLAPPRDALYERIERRVDAMMAAGFLDEVKDLLARGYDPGLKSLQSLGYRHLAAFLAGTIDLETAVAQLKRDTRRYAKRQLSWFKADPRVVWLTRNEGSETADETAGQIAARLAHRDAAAPNQDSARAPLKEKEFR